MEATMEALQQQTNTRERFRRFVTAVVATISSALGGTGLTSAADQKPTILSAEADLVREVLTIHGSNLAKARLCVVHGGVTMNVWSATPDQTEAALAPGYGPATYVLTIGHGHPASASGEGDLCHQRATADVTI